MFFVNNLLWFSIMGLRVFTMIINYRHALFSNKKGQNADIGNSGSFDVGLLREVRLQVEINVQRYDDG